MKMYIDQNFAPYKITLTVNTEDEHQTLVELTQDPTRLKVLQHATPYQHGGQLQTCSDLPERQQKLLNQLGCTLEDVAV